MMCMERAKDSKKIKKKIKKKTTISRITDKQLSGPVEKKNKEKRLLYPHPNNSLQVYFPIGLLRLVMVKFNFNVPLWYG